MWCGCLFLFPNYCLAGLWTCDFFFCCINRNVVLSCAGLFKEKRNRGNTVVQYKQIGSKAVVGMDHILW